MAFKTVATAFCLLTASGQAQRAYLRCANDVCESQLKLHDQALGTTFAVPRGSDATGAVATAVGPGVFILRDMDSTCDCSVELPSLNKKYLCKNKEDIDNGIDLPEGDVEVKFIGSESLGCFKVLGEVTPPVDEIVKALNTPSAAGSMSVGDEKKTPEEIISAASQQGMAQAEARKVEQKSLKGRDEEICNRISHGVQMLVLQELPDSTHAREIQLFMSHMADIFDDFKAGLSYFGGAAECFREAVKLGDFPDVVQSDFSSAMKQAATYTEASPKGSPLKALQAAAEMIDWETPAEGKEVLRIVLMDATTPPQANSDACQGGDAAAVAKALSDRGISVVFFVTPESEPSYTAFKEQNNVAGHVQVLKPRRSMMSVNLLTTKVKASLSKMCSGEGERLLL